MTHSSLARLLSGALLLGLLGAFAACGDDDDGGGAGGTQADRHGIGAECATADDCAQPVADAGPPQSCLQTFRGGYCGSTGCTLDTDCPDGAACVAHTDGINYCFRTCVAKSECNRNRSAANESNCSSSITFTDPNTTAPKACVPPSSG